MLEPQARARPYDHTSAYGHSRTRTTSSNILPGQGQPQGPGGNMSLHLAQPGPPPNFSRRSPSVNTFSTASSIPPPAAYRNSSSTDLRRSISSRSGGTITQPSGYVALLRKQKATVWCDRAQYEDPRLAAQQRAAKMRANLEVVGGPRGASGSRTNTGISATGKVAAKIRHHGKTPVVGYAPGENHVGVGGVPMRLSATEVEGESSDDDDGQIASRLHHRRTGSSGRSSTGSGRRNPPYRASGAIGSHGSQRWSPGDTPERSGSLVTEEVSRPVDDAASAKAHSSKSGSSAERADNLGELGNAPRLASNSLMHSALTREKSVKSPEELKRRGSVDERTATLTSGRLFIANPD
ncbi:Thioredoxin [Purpureocillium lavendulum]|uniref:Thioredoxin n=1 Tax=Purpureocillium lavendulum TaxID=1247861 RepID=A0AB34FIP8_9HYPO|nr:Thioredoxin [Purpureocillium lavendulum]